MTAKPTVSLGDRFEDSARVGVVLEVKEDRARVEWRDKSKAPRRSTWVLTQRLLTHHKRAASSDDLSARLARAEAEAARLRKLVDGDDSWAAMAMRYGAGVDRALEALRSPSPRNLADAEVMCSDALAGPSRQLGLLDEPDPLDALRDAVRDETCLNIHRSLIRMLVEAEGGLLGRALAVDEPSAIEFIQWIREWDPACSAAHDWVYNAGAYPEADPYTEEQVANILEQVGAVRHTMGRLGYGRAIEIRTLAGLLSGDFDKRIGADPMPIDRARLSNCIRESQANVMLPREGRGP